MFARLFLLFVAVPLTDLVLLLMLARLTSVWVTLAVVVVTGAVGAWFARRQWHWLLERSRSRMANHELPAEVVTDGFLILIGAVLLITPGILTDLAGFTLMLPRWRAWYRKIGKNWVSQRLTVFRMQAEEYSRAEGQTGYREAEQDHGTRSGVVDGTARESAPR